MKNILISFFKNYDWFLLGSTIFLCVIGLAVLYSTTFEPGLKSEAVRQSIFMVMGFVLLFFLARTDYRVFKNYSAILYIILVILLTFLAIARYFNLPIGGLGKEAMGATRWINLGFFQFQPSLLAQLFMALILGKYFSERYEDMKKIGPLIRSGVYVAIPTVLVAMQPDLGSATVFVFMWLMMVIVSNAKRIYLILLGLLGLGSLPLAWPFMHEYQRHRILTFINPSLDLKGSGWNVNQAMIAIGSGQMWGRGLGQGSQSQLNFIPEKHTDFVFASLAEEMGFVGVSLLLSLFGILLFRGVRIAILARDFFGTYLSVGIVTMLFVHIFVNIGMNMGLMPVTGIPLPFISYGGTPVLVDLMAIGILESVYRRYRKIDF